MTSREYDSKEYLFIVIFHSLSSPYFCKNIIQNNRLSSHNRWTVTYKDTGRKCRLLQRVTAFFKICTLQVCYKMHYYCLVIVLLLHYYCFVIVVLCIIVSLLYYYRIIIK